MRIGEHYVNCQKLRVLIIGGIWHKNQGTISKVLKAGGAQIVKN